ncbi:MAG: complex I NDUFA9 subunit family protein, partial [Verrucomicrobiota bacterium]
GGSGFVGREIVRQLLADGHAVRVLARGTRAAVPGVETCRGSVLDPATLPFALAGCDAVIHLVGIISEVGDQTYDRVHAEGTGHLLRAARAAGVARFIHMSALGTRPQAASRYHRSKWEAEEQVRASGLAWVIHRPSLVYGPGDGFVNLFAGLSRWSPVVPVIGHGRTLFQPVAVGDVARAFVASLARETATGRTFDLCGPERLSFDQLVAEILAAAGRRRWTLHLPFALAHLQATALEWVVGGLLRRPPPLNRDQVRMLREDNVGDPGPMERELGVRPIAFREGIRQWLG